MARIDDHFDAYRAEDLKRIAKRWGPNPPARTGDCPKFIRDALDNPARVQTFIEKLKPFELAALGLVKMAEGHITMGGLNIALRAAGLALPEGRTWSFARDDSGAIEDLAKNGILIGLPRDFQFYFDWGNVAAEVDERLLAIVPPLSVAPLMLATTREPISALMRRPQTVTLDLLKLLQSIDKLGSLRVTRTGSLRAGDERKLAKELGWKTDVMEVDRLEFPAPTYAFIMAYFFAGLLIADHDALLPSASARRFSTVPLADSVRRILFGFARSDGWTEDVSGATYFGRPRHSHARFALLMLLLSLPVDREEWLSVDGLSETLFERIGEFFSLQGPISKQDSYYRVPAEIKKSEAERREKLKAAWRSRERGWIGRALSTWLYFLGVVELGLDGKQPVSFRLTPLGRVVLHPALAEQTPEDNAAGGPAWVVQPNMEVVVYLEHASAAQMAFLEAHAERQNLQQHTAHYRLTRDSVYRGLEGGTQAETVLETLRAGSAHDLPQNVRVEIVQWAGLREQMTLRQNARLLEYGSQSARDLGLRDDPRAVALGDRYILLPQHVSAKAFRPRQTINYLHPLPACLTVDEKGEVKIAGNSRDLLVEAQLDRWAERTGEGKWQFTQTSISNAARNGAKRKQLSEWLDERLVQPMPDLIRIALNAWMGQKIEVGLSKVTLLQCKKEEVFNAIVDSSEMSTVIAGVVAPDLIMIKDNAVEQFRSLLNWMGLRVVDEIEVVDNVFDLDDGYDYDE